MKTSLRSRLLAALVLPLASSAFAAAAVPAAATTTVNEMRIYTTNPGKFDDLLARFRDHTMRFFERHGIRNVVYFTPVAGAEGAGNTLLYFIEHKSREAATAGWAAFQADPDWIAVRAASEAGGAILVRSPDSTFMKLADYSPAIRTGYVSFRTPRLFELRRHTVDESKLASLQTLVRGRLLELYAKHGMTVIGIWEPTDAAKGAGKELDILLAYPNRAAADQSWRNLRADPAYAQATAEAEAGVKSLFLTPVDYSPIK